MGVPNWSVSNIFAVRRVGLGPVRSLERDATLGGSCGRCGRNPMLDRACWIHVTMVGGVRRSRLEGGGGCNHLIGHWRNVFLIDARS